MTATTTRSRLRGTCTCARSDTRVRHPQPRGDRGLYYSITRRWGMIMRRREGPQIRRTWGGVRSRRQGGPQPERRAMQRPSQTSMNIHHLTANCWNLMLRGQGEGKGATVWGVRARGQKEDGREVNFWPSVRASAANEVSGASWTWAGLLSYPCHGEGVTHSIT